MKFYYIHKLKTSIKRRKTYFFIIYNSYLEVITIVFTNIASDLKLLNLYLLILLTCKKLLKNKICFPEFISK